MSGEAVPRERPRVFVVDESGDDATAPRDGLGGVHAIGKVGRSAVPQPHRTNLEPERSRHLIVDHLVERATRGALDGGAGERVAEIAVERCEARRWQSAGGVGTAQCSRAAGCRRAASAKRGRRSLDVG